jgi:anti-sigma factor RsiW
MADPRCEQLDEYMCGWLLPDEVAEFEAHLAGCSVCQEHCAAQREIDRMLAEEAVEVEAVPAVVADRIERGVRAARRRRLMGWACGLTAAGVVLALGFWGIQMARGPAAIGNSRELAAPLPFAKPPAVAAARVTLADSSSAILVPVESHSPNVTVVCIFPTTNLSRADTERVSP